MGMPCVSAFPMLLKAYLFHVGKLDSFITQASLIVQVYISQEPFHVLSLITYVPRWVLGFKTVWLRQSTPSMGLMGKLCPSLKMWLHGWARFCFQKTGPYQGEGADLCAWC